MRRYSVAISELPETAGKSAAIVQMNPAFGINPRNRDNFAVSTVESLRPTIGSQHEFFG